MCFLNKEKFTEIITITVFFKFWIFLQKNRLWTFMHPDNENEECCLFAFLCTLFNAVYLKQLFFYSMK